jgi:hypothetical protein
MQRDKQYAARGHPHCHSVPGHWHIQGLWDCYWWMRSWEHWCIGRAAGAVPGL